MLKSMWRLFVSDRAVRYSLISRFLSLTFGPITLICIGTFLRPEDQGIYYLFGSLLQLGVFIDLGFSKSAQQLLAHAFGPLHLQPRGEFCGSQEPLLKFLLAAKSIFQIYSFLGVTALCALGIIGHIYLKLSLGGPHSDIIAAWWTLTASLLIGIGLQGFPAVADAANLLDLTNKWRLISEVAGLTVFIGALICGAGIWSSVLLSWIRYSLTIIPIGVALGSKPWIQILKSHGSDFNYRKDILPLQIRNMVSYSMGFLIYFCYTPITLSILGPVAAGVIGMSLQIANMVQGISIIWFNTKIPLMGNLAGRGSLDDLITLHRQGTRISTICLMAISFLAVIGAAVGKWLLPEIGNRYGSVTEITLFVVGSGGFVWTHIRAAYLRSYRIEPFVFLCISQAILTTTALIVCMPMVGRIAASGVYAVTMIFGAIWTEITFQKFVKGKHRLSFLQSV